LHESLLLKRNEIERCPSRGEERETKKGPASAMELGYSHLGKGEGAKDTPDREINGVGKRKRKLISFPLRVPLS